MSRNYLCKKVIPAILIIILTILFTVNAYLGISVEHLVYSPDFSLQKLAHKNDVKLPLLIKSLNQGNIKTNIQISKTNISQNQLKESIIKIKKQNAKKDMIKYILWSIWLSFVLLFVTNRKDVLLRRSMILFVPIVLFGVLLGGYPTPGELLVLFVLFSLLGNKLICGWGCQLGALQETLFNIPIFKRKYKIHVPFLLSLPVRIVVYLTSLALMYGWIFGIKDFSIYKYISYFPIYDLKLSMFAVAFLPVFLLLCFFTYRPFCHYVCTMGLFSLIAEKFSLNRINIDRSKCINCKLCTKVCPTQAMSAIYENKPRLTQPDCWSCGRCQSKCSTDAIRYE